MLVANLIENAMGKLLAEDKASHKRWTKYCTELHKYKLKADASILKREEEVEKAVQMLKDGKLLGADNITARILNKKPTNCWGRQNAVPPKFDP